MPPTQAPATNSSPTIMAVICRPILRRRVMGGLYKGRAGVKIRPKAGGFPHSRRPFRGLCRLRYICRVGSGAFHTESPQGGKDFVMKLSSSSVAIALYATSLIVAAGTRAIAADWPQYRGPQHDGATAATEKDI